QDNVSRIPTLGNIVEITKKINNKTDPNICIREFFAYKSNSFGLYPNLIYQNILLELRKAFLDLRYYLMLLLESRKYGLDSASDDSPLSCKGNG
ncbi:hypothetical protein HZS_5709, partial [Henneguya salminicola]